MFDEYFQDRALKMADSLGYNVKECSVFREFSTLSVKAVSDESQQASGVRIYGYLSTFKNVDRQNDIVEPTAFDRTIKEIRKNGGKLPMLRDHRPSTDFQLGSWDVIKVDAIGLYVEGSTVDSNLTSHTNALIKEGHINTLSMGGLIWYGEAPSKKGNNVIKEVMLLEGSVVCIPCNSMAQFEMKSLTSEKSYQVVNSNESRLSANDRVRECIKKYNLRSYL